MTAADVRTATFFTHDGAPPRLLVDGGTSVTHALVVDDRTGAVDLMPVVSLEPRPGLAKPDWHEASVGAADCSFTLAMDAVDDLAATLRLGLAARARAAASRCHELALEYARTREAFGKPIGAYQAVSHRAANGAIDLTALGLLLMEAAASIVNGAPDRHLSAELAIAYAVETLPRVQFDNAHTLAAQGYFEEHEAPWLFRRLHADLVRLRAIPPASGEPAEQLLRASRSLPALGLGESAEQFRQEVRKVLAPFSGVGAVQHLDAPPSPDLLAAFSEAGYFSLAWPKEFGGADAPIEHQIVLAEELAAHNIHLEAKIVADMFGTAILRHGTPEQCERFLPLLNSGRLTQYLAYSEPEVGSDLAHLRTRAVREGDDWVVNGSKMWGTGAQRAEYVWLAARTDPDATPPHAGITLFLTPIEGSGWEAQQHVALSGEISCTTFFDDFRVPDSDRIGEVNGGWKVIGEALAQERIAMANIAAECLRLLEDLLAATRDRPDVVGPVGSAARATITQLSARVQAARVLVAASVRATAAGGGARLEAPMAKVVAASLYEDFGVSALGLLGPSAILGEDVADVPGCGGFEYALRASIMHAVGGGTIDIQRNLIARSLGMAKG
ncbi:acyl-CoA dehydrogenase family protein [Nocardioides terrisoli]|uniref:acyl-CoA dehydrogenase family protein n=1 Tax=Nocardioides terrisoli TaxID=3388267 RepID=UPI00287BBC26|nr:acyl-CoA dehydrogenase family protein [Nocardioides marmorisolisilvae]